VIEIIEQQFREFDSDKHLAKFLQIEERISCGNEIDERGLSDLEYKIYKLKFQDNEPSREHEIEPQLLYDQFQREADKEIAHLNRRESDKRNSNAVPIHLKRYRKFTLTGDIITVRKSQRGKPSNCKNRKNNKKFTESSLIFPIKTENLVYGQVVLLPGACHVQCWVDSSVKFCRISGSVKSKIRVNKWDIVLISVRPYQQSRGDIVYVYNGEEREKLLEMNHLICLDPLSNLTPDCINILMTYFDKEWLIKIAIAVSKKWFYIANLYLEEKQFIPYATDLCNW